ncbi:MAG: leucine--tRNA ligase [Candidatus Yanofskybacteria bacterium RIFCSPHIGHO2_01_FULL_44_17]|uniref:Leucine--tRNA ligase n=1 Tax=Candidatus Yanofskybacteria bacterium RIFCSPHIGHO2_01_FULL_44_17 TaxID=1802668 RepID=A0A1F8EUJ1_9BACT|nr:MAG: leucine--tRNA ligase [Candidatus Yanofskybacteria bacterium RIFCSPHIGHO2_01_FULL_44_17]
MKKYNPKQIESKWQKYWEAKKVYNTKEAENNYMLLTEFPYPSGNLHIGHWYAFALPDILARYLRMTGKNVMYPIGFDAFGLPAENAAIKNNIHPETWTKKNITYMTKQLKSMGATFDWSREVQTIDPDYYKWTQWMFLKFYEKGWVYRAATKVNWCPNDKTVLANEQVVDGRCDRCDSEVIQKELTQWMFKITEFADDLAGGLKDLDWQETAKLGQLNWIGRSEGAKIKFKLTDIPGQKDGRHFVDAFTTRADTLFGVTAVVISPELAQKWIDVGWRASEEVKEYVKKSLTKRELERQETAEKTGIDAGIFAVNPINDEKIPVWVADYVLGHYGTGAVMFVPAHDQRDYEFAKKYSLLIKTVVEPVAIEKNLTNEAYVGPGILANSGKYNGVESEDAKKKITEELKLSGFGDFQRTYRLHDWVLSRQRYWGVPIPMVNCLKCGYQPAPEKDLPIKLPSLEDFKPADDGRSPLAKATKWLKVKCPKCEGEAERETDTMDTFVDSSWYFMRYTDPKNKKEFASKEKMAKWLPVPMYIGGAEHTTMHLLYARFFAKALQKLGHVDFLEPFIGRRNRGIILGPDHQKMSKSRGNVVDPDIEVKKYGADAVRMYLAFMGPYEQGGPWSPGGIIGVYRFLSRVWNVFNFAKDVVLPSAKNIVLHKTIKKIGEDIQNMRFNTGVSELMKLLNELESYQLPVSVQKTFLQLLAPFAPHMTEEVWINVMKNKNSIHLEKWPKYDPKLIIEEKVALVVQVNGKTRDVIKASGSLSEEEVRKLALASDKIKKHLVGKDVKKFIYVPGRLINLVI